MSKYYFDLGNCDEMSDEDHMASGREAKAEREAIWRKEGHGITWVDPQPDWVSACDWSLWLGYPQHPCIRMMRFVLIGGGQIKVQERFYADPKFNLILNDSAYGPRLTVKAETADGIAIGKGKLATALGEIVCMDAVLMHPRHQVIAERTADTLRLIHTDANNFAALLNGSDGCAFCTRRLNDHISKLLGYGPVCAQTYGLPHTLEAANAKLAKRRELLSQGRAGLPQSWGCKRQEGIFAFFVGWEWTRGLGFEVSEDRRRSRGAGCGRHGDQSPR